MSLEMAQKVIVPQKKNYVPHFLKQPDINSYYEPACRIFFGVRICYSLILFGLFKPRQYFHGIKNCPRVDFVDWNSRNSCRGLATFLTSMTYPTSRIHRPVHISELAKCKKCKPKIRMEQDDDILHSILWVLSFYAWALEGYGLCSRTYL